MKKIYKIIIITFLVVAVSMCARVQGSKSGKAPGLTDGKLTRCPGKPNCVSSEEEKNSDHYVEPLKYEGDVLAALKYLKDSVKEMGGNFVSVSDNYAAVIFKTKVFGFIDDLEIRIDRKRKLIHMRSASRVGYSDLGVNRKRIETLRTLYLKRSKQ